MTIKDIISKINEDIQCLIGVKDSPSAIDSIVKEKVRKYFEEKDMYYNSWNIKNHIDYDFNIAKLELEFKHDKRTKHDTKWTVLTVNFVISDSSIENMTVLEANKYIKDQARVKWIANIDKEIEYHTIEIEKLNKQRQEIVDEGEESPENK